MPKLKTPLLSLEARGRLGKLLSLVRRGRRNIIERRPIPVDAKSPSQLFIRHMFTKCIDLWHLLSEAEKQEWESAARSRHMTGYAWYISQCLRPNPGIYLPLQGGTMSGDMDMDKNRLLKLPLPTDVQEAASKAYVDAHIPLAHKGTHENGGTDEIDVGGLSGLLADAQRPSLHSFDKHTDTTRELVIPAAEGWTDGLVVKYGRYVVVEMADGVTKQIALSFKVPDDFVSFNFFRCIWTTPAASDAKAMRVEWETWYAAHGEIVNTHADNPPAAGHLNTTIIFMNITIPAAAGRLTFPNIAKGDVVGFHFSRLGGDALDTLSEIARIIGFIFEYEGEQ